MYQKLIVYLSVFAIGMFFASCKKSNSKSSEKDIYSFEILISVNASLSKNIYGTITGDSIYLPVPQGVSLANMMPSIAYEGVSISPTAMTAQNFDAPVTYTVTATDGSMVSYVVVPQVLSDSKSITSFVFKAANNPGLSADLTGVIGADTIVIYADSTASLSGLIPTITYTGVQISPDSGIKEDFSNPVTYTVTAQDKTQKLYTVIVSPDHFLYVGSDDGNLYALDAATGSLVWKFTTGGSIRSSPTLYNGLIYFLSTDTYVYAVNAANGQIQWKYQAMFDGQSEANSSSPTVQSGTVYVNTSDYLAALDAATGSVKWLANVGFYSSGNSPTVVNGVVYDPTFSYAGPVAACI
jgi:eukaryotic-like serine/threonine-protein kinase